MAFRRHDRMLVRWLAQKFGDIETARDIAQSAYLRVWRYAQTQQIDNLQALIFKTAANLAANEFRARKRLRALKFDSATSHKEFLVEQVASEQPSPEAAAVTKEQIAASMRAIESLPAQARRAFVLSRFEDKTYREIAGLLGVSESSVEKYIIAALKALRAAAEETDRSPNIIPLPNRRDRR
ncbi:MAG: sigma-70 family RNA polymerase sigma factor [Pseudomonadota bacterium]